MGQAHEMHRHALDRRGEKPVLWVRCARLGGWFRLLPAQPVPGRVDSARRACQGPNVHPRPCVRFGVRGFPLTTVQTVESSANTCNQVSPTDSMMSLIVPLQPSGSEYPNAIDVTTRDATAPNTHDCFRHLFATLDSSLKLCKVSLKSCLDLPARQGPYV